MTRDDQRALISTETTTNSSGFTDAAI